ncbi:hypothetical protein [Coleofasciculus sp.]|uniref:hypothetical protein n=1 Tax=Coleofasciculus sp. TaxID=3100458 RepID=UPI003A401205
MVKISLLSSTPLWFFHLVPYKIGECFFINLLPLFIVQVVGGSITDVGKATMVGSLVSGYIAASFGYSWCFATGTVLTGLTVVCFWLLELIMQNDS